MFSHIVSHVMWMCLWFSHISPVPTHACLLVSTAYIKYAIILKTGYWSINGQADYQIQYSAFPRLAKSGCFFFSYPITDIIFDNLNMQSNYKLIVMSSGLEV